VKEHDRIVLTTNIAAEGLQTGDVGTIVHVHRNGEAFEVEFLSLAGRTITVATVNSADVRPVSNSDFTHARGAEAVS